MTSGKAATVLLTCMLFAGVASGDYDISWSTIDSGGGKSSGGEYELSGTIGQAEPGVSQGGDYVVSGGFWPGSYGCVVNMTDLARFMAQWLDTGLSLSADIDDSGRVDLSDLSNLAQYWYNWCPAGWTLK